MQPKSLALPSPSAQQPGCRAWPEQTLLRGQVTGAWMQPNSVYLGKKVSLVCLFLLAPAPQSGISPEQICNNQRLLTFDPENPDRQSAECKFCRMARVWHGRGSCILHLRLTLTLTCICWLKFTKRGSPDAWGWAWGPSECEGTGTWCNGAAEKGEEDARTYLSCGSHFQMTPPFRSWPHRTKSITF